MVVVIRCCAVLAHHHDVAYTQVKDKVMHLGGVFKPVVDGVDLTAQIDKLIKNKKTAGVPVLLGSNRDDLQCNLGTTIQCTSPSECSKDDFRRFAVRLQQGIFPRLDPDLMVTVYGSAETKLPGGANSKWWWAARHARSDYCMACAARRAATWFDKAYLYLFTHVPVGVVGL